MSYSFRMAALVLLAASACRPDQPATSDQPATERPPASPPKTAAASAAARPTDTLCLSGGQVARLRPTTAAAFYRLPVSGLPDLANDPAAEHLPIGSQVRRQGLGLLLQPAQGSVVRLASTPDAQFTLQNADGVKYMYWGTLPAAHQWVVRAWYWESDATVLVEQRTGRRLEVPGHPVASPDGRYVLLTSPGLGGGDQPNTLALVQVAATGPRLLWQRELTTWEPVAAAWAAPDRVVLKRRHTLSDGSMADDAQVTYDELTLPQPDP